jgi:hypothetical protein
VNEHEDAAMEQMIGVAVLAFRSERHQSRLRCMLANPQEIEKSADVVFNATAASEAMGNSEKIRERLI